MIIKTILFIIFIILSIILGIKEIKGFNKKQGQNKPI